MSWTQDRERKLIELFGRGLSAGEIAEQLGGFEQSPDKGRRAVGSKLSRLGLCITQPRYERQVEMQYREPWNPARDPKPEKRA